MKTTKLLLALTLLFSQAGAIAGSVDGPYVVWVNLAKQPDAADKQIRRYVNSDDTLCWNSQAILFMRDKPIKITPALVTNAILKKDQKAIRQLSTILAQPHGNEAKGGFDGIVAYTDKPAPTIYSLRTGHRQIKRIKLDLQTEPRDLEFSFCSVLPPISRKP